MQGISERIQYTLSSFGDKNWIESLPEKHGDETCSCGLCDGYGTIIEDGTARYCPVFYGLKPVDIVTKEFISLNETLKGWEGWPTPTFHDFRQEKRFKPTLPYLTCLKFFEYREPKGLFLCGRNGRGKTFSSLILLKELSLKKMPCYAFRFPDLISFYKRGFEGTTKVDSVFGAINRSKVVLVDELGRESLAGNPDHTRQAMDSIVTMCYRQKHLIVTTNLSKKEILSESWFGSNIKSRLKESTGYCTFIEDLGEDLR